MIKQIFLILIIFFKSQMFYSQETELIKIDTVKYKSKKCENCPEIQNIIVYKLLKCGLYKGSNGDIVLKSSRLINDFESVKTYINLMWGSITNDSINGGRTEIKNVIDVETFKFLNFSYWRDKTNIYFYIATSDGGSISLVENIDIKSFKIFGETRYAKDKLNVYYGGNIIENADPKTFKIIAKENLHSDFAYDKTNFYEFENKLTETEIKEYNLKRD